MKKWRFFCTSSGTFGTSVCVSVSFFPDQLNGLSGKFIQRSFLKISVPMHYNMKG